ncbi:MAG: cupin domain-containing protein [Actinomycetota bacterium]|nr:cupin domain-containing protein [Actinomycetota bacterium]
MENYKFNEKQIQKKYFDDRWVRFAFGLQGHIKSENLSLGVVEFDKNIRSLTHAHEVDEALYVLSGKGQIDINGKINDAEKGDFLFIPKMAEHTIITSDISKLRILFIFAGKIHIDY